MICPKCGTDNKTKFKFCVKCGSNLENPEAVNIEQVDMGGYRSEEDYASEKNNFTIGSGTFTIKDRAPVKDNGMFTADELNDTDEEFDFSSFDEPFIPKLDAGRLKVPTGAPQQNVPTGGMAANPQQMPMGGMPVNPQQMPQSAPMGGMPVNPQQMPMGGMPVNPQQMQQGAPANGMNQYMGQMYGGQPAMYGQPMMQPQIMGYDQNGMPIYGQAPQMMYGQPMIMGYDQNGMPIYGQAPQMMYGQPVIMGYDQNGMPIYGQAPQMMYGQPAMNENGENMPHPAMGQPVMPQYPGMPGAVPPQMAGAPYGVPQQPTAPTPQAAPQAAPQTAPKPEKNSGGQVKVSNEFWNNFFSEEEDDSNGQDDFFSKSRHDSGSDMGSVSTNGLNMDGLKKKERKKVDYMGVTPDVNADELAPNTNDKINKMYMRGVVNAASDLGNEKDRSMPIRKREFMNTTEEVDEKDLEVNEHKKSRITMHQAGVANAEDLEVFTREHKEAIMAEADHAVEALPKKKTTDELDDIELPEYMQARKTVHSATPEIPGVPNLK